MQGDTFLCIAPRIWDSLWRGSQQVMSRVAAHNRVLYFEPGRDYDRPALPEWWRTAPNFFGLRARRVHENLIIIPTPSRLPFARRHLPRALLRLTTPLVSAFNERLLIRHVRWAMREFDVVEPILWINECYPDLVGKFGEKLSVYYNYDEFPDFDSNARIRDILRASDNRLTASVDLVFATSRAQCERRRAINPHTYFIPNGVDFDLFNQALSPDLRLPDDIAALPPPIIGFAGWLGHHIDVELLCEIAAGYPDCSVALVGPDALPDTPARQRLRSLPNVFFLGEKPREELPRYLRAFDVALMPWAVHRGHVRFAYPLKLHEYLAAGRSIVAVALPELQPYGHVLRIAETHQGFVEHIRAALHDHSPASVEARLAVARENTWDGRVAEMYRLLQHHLAASRRGVGRSERASRPGSLASE